MKPKIDTFNLYVKEMKQTIKFYRLLNLKIAEGSEHKSYAKVEDSMISFYDQKTVHTFFGDKICFNNPCHSFNISLRVITPSQVDEIYNSVIQEGFSSFQPPINTDWGQRVAFLLDPDGNLIELNALLDSEQS
ncbi:MAG: VOC family protein [Candidatus Hodarchaeales archaeon]|jgi:predicted lactoylglutathione lyase